MSQNALLRSGKGLGTPGTARKKKDSSSLRLRRFERKSVKIISW